MTYVIEPLHFSPENKVVDWLLDEAATLTAHKLQLLGDAAFFYALLFFIEGVGLLPAQALGRIFCRDRDRFAAPV